MRGKLVAPTHDPVGENVQRGPMSAIILRESVLPSTLVTHKTMQVAIKALTFTPDSFCTWNATAYIETILHS